MPSEKRETNGELVSVGSLFDMSLMDRIRDPEANKRRRQVKARWCWANRELAKAMNAAQREDWERHKARLGSTARRVKYEALMRELDLPTAKVKLCESGLRETHARRHTRAMLEGEKTFLILGGVPGTGKTIAAIEVVLERAKKGKSSCFIHAISLANLGFRDDEKRKLEWARSSKLLVIDDLGAEPQSERWLATLYELIDYRYGRSLKTIITTNLPAIALAGEPTVRTRYGDRIADRIASSGQFSRCGTESLRRPQEQE